MAWGIMTHFYLRGLQDNSQSKKSESPVEIGRAVKMSRSVLSILTKLSRIFLDSEKENVSSSTHLDTNGVVNIQKYSIFGIYVIIIIIG